MNLHSPGDDDDDSEDKNEDVGEDNDNGEGDDDGDGDDLHWSCIFPNVQNLSQIWNWLLPAVAAWFLESPADYWSAEWQNTTTMFSTPVVSTTISTQQFAFGNLTFGTFQFKWYDHSVWTWGTCHDTPRNVNRGKSPIVVYMLIKWGGVQY